VTARRLFARGDVIKVAFPYPADSGRPPPITKYVVVLQGGDYWRFHSVLLVALITSQVQTTNWPHLVFIPAGSWKLPDPSWIDCGDLYCIGRDLLEAGEITGPLPDDIIKKVDQALLVGNGTYYGGDLIEV